MVESKLTAVRNGKFWHPTRKQWDLLGTDKYGWELVPDVPKEVAHIHKGVGTTVLEPITTGTATAQPTTTKKNRKPRKK